MSSSKSFHTLFFLSWSTSWDRQCWHRCLREFLWRPGSPAGGTPCVQVGAQARPGQGCPALPLARMEEAEAAQGNLCQLLTVRIPAGLSPDRVRLLFALMLLEFSLSHPATPEPSPFQESGLGPSPLAPSPALLTHTELLSLLSLISLLSLLPPRHTRPLPALPGRVQSNSLSKEILEPPAAFPAAAALLAQPRAPTAAARAGTSSVPPGAAGDLGMSGALCGSPRCLGGQEGG